MKPKRGWLSKAATSCVGTQSGTASDVTPSFIWRTDWRDSWPRLRRMCTGPCLWWQTTASSRPFYCPLTSADTHSWRNLCSPTPGRQYHHDYVWGGYRWTSLSSAATAHRSPLSVLQVFSSASWWKPEWLYSQGTQMTPGFAHLMTETEVVNYFSLSCPQKYANEWKNLLFCCRRTRKHWSHTRASWFFRYSRQHLLEEQDWHTTW